MKNTFQLTVQSREGLLYKGSVQSLTSKNEAGKFDVLAQHANFITLISSILEFREENGNLKQLKIDNGLLRVKGSSVEVYLGIEGLIPFKAVPTPPSNS